MKIIVVADRGRGRKPISATFETREAAEAAIRGWLRYFRLTVTVID